MDVLIKSRLSLIQGRRIPIEVRWKVSIWVGISFVRWGNLDSWVVRALAVGWSSYEELDHNTKELDNRVENTRILH